MFKTYNILTEEEADGVVKQIQMLEWEEGKARTEELTGTIKKNKELLQDDSPVAKALAEMVGKKVINHRKIQLDWMPQKLLGVKFNKYENNGTYNRHTDSSMMRDVRTDMACTIFLTDDYDGGELCIETPHGVMKHKGKKGDCVVYECGRPHWVTPVTRGERISGITWLQSFVKDPWQRRVLLDLQSLIFEIEEKMDAADDEDYHRKWFVDGGTIHADLMRMWGN